MKPARSAWVLSFGIVLLLFFLRLMTQGSSRPKPSAHTKETQPIAPPPLPAVTDEDSDADSAQDSAAPNASRSPNSVTRILTAVALALAIVPGASLVTAGTAFAAAIHDSGDKVDQDTVQLNWTGNGLTNGSFDQQCDTNADPGSGGFQNGADATNYILWVFNTDGGGIVGDFTITVNGTTYGNSNGNNQIVTPSYDPALITDAHTNFVVNTTGNGAWILTISHGCGNGTVEDQVVNPDGSIHGPCADPSYYGVFDNSATTDQTITFRFRWYTTTGLHTKKKDVPAGAIYTTYIHWAKPGTYVYLGYKDPTTGVWTPLDKVLADHGRFAPCDYQPGWSTPPQ